MKRPGDTQQERSLHGLVRKLVANMAEGVGKGFTRVLEINGVGYRAEVRGSNIHFTLGYSHPIVYQLPPGVTAKVERQVTITLESADRQLIGSVAAQVRELQAARAVQGQGHQVRNREDSSQGRQGGGRRGGGLERRERIKMAAERFAKRMERRRRVRRKVRGSDERPRLSVYRSLNHIYAQVMSDDSGQTLVAASTLSAELREGLKSRRNVQAAKVVGKTIAERCLEQGNQPGHLRPQWLSLSWPGEGAGRRGARSGT